MTTNPSPNEKTPRKFRLSDLVDRDRYFYFTAAGLVGIIFILVVVLWVSRGSARPQAAELSLATPPNATQAGGSEGESSSPTAEAAPTLTKTVVPQTALSRALLTSDDLNALLDIWSDKSTDIQNDPQFESNLMEAAGRTFVTRSRDIELTLEVYRFSGEQNMAFRVSNTVKQIYLQERGYANTELDCPSSWSGYSWILADQASHRLLLGSAVGEYFLSAQLSSEARIDQDNAAKLICSVTEKQLEVLLTSHSAPEGKQVD